MEGEKQRRCRRKTGKEEDGFVDDIIFEILTWVPAKSLMQFKCVCKAWNNLIGHDVSFVKLHFARSSARGLPIRLLFEVRVRISYIILSKNGYSLTQVERFPLQLERFPLQLMSSYNCSKFIVWSNYCNGLVCLRKDGEGYLYNMTTGEIKALPSSLRYKAEWNCPRLFMGYDPATERYKLLRRVKRPSPEIKILTLGDNSWRGVSGNIPDRHNFWRSGGCAFLNGVLYWDNYMQNIFTYFNLTEEKFGTLSLVQESKISEIQTAFWGKLIMHPPDQPNNCHLVYDEVNKVFTKFDSDLHLVEDKLACLEADNIDKRIGYNQTFFATSSAISTSTYLVFSNLFSSKHVNKFVENIIPLEYLF